MFSFGGASTPAFGAAASTPGFGAAAPTPSLFGAASSAAAAPAFGAAAPSPFGGGVATPAFGAASSGASLFGAAPAGGGLFGAASTPSLFGAASTGGLFGAASAPSMFGAASAGALTTFGAAAAPSMFGAPPAAGGQQGVTALATADGRPITHSSKWDELAPQTQQYLSELERVVVGYREDCRQLDADPRLASASGAQEQQGEMAAAARSLSQAISGLGSAVKADVEQVGALREAVLYLVRATDTALHTFKRSHAWREAAKASAPLAAQDIAGPPVLPSSFLREAVAGFLDRLRQHQAAVAELEAVLLAASSSGSGHGGAARRGGAHPGDGLQALQGALANVHDVLIHTAARLQALDDRVSAAREAHLAARRGAGDASDPFDQEERRQARHAENQPRSPSAQAAALAAAQQQLTPGGGYAAGAGGGVSASPSPAQVAAASPAGLFGTVSPGSAFGTPFGQQQRTPGSSRKPSSRRR